HCSFCPSKADSPHLRQGAAAHKKEKAMKTRRMVSLVAAVLCLSGLAAAQQIIDFSGLPLTGAPLPIPSGYAGMNWNDLWYTTLRFTEGIRNVAVPAFGSGAQSMTAANP